MLPPHLPASRKVSNRAKIGRGPQAETTVKSSKASRIAIKGDLRIHGGNSKPMIVKIRTGKA